MEQQANKHRREPNFTVGDKVQVIIKNQKTERPSYKLDCKIAGPYKILNKEGNLYKVKLLDSIKAHPVFLPDFSQAGITTNDLSWLVGRDTELYE